MYPSSRELDSSPSIQREADWVQERFQAAMTAHQAGRIDEAVDGYTVVLHEDSTHAGAWHLIGVTHNQHGDSAKAIEFIERALSFCDSKAIYWNNYGAALKDSERFEDAKAASQRAIDIRDDYPDAWSNLGVMHLEHGLIGDQRR